jgi:dethiobiotin synthetase
MRTSPLRSSRLRHRYFVTGTDTDIGKTRVTAALALALRDAGVRPTIVKIVQTGVQQNQEGDAQRAAGVAGTPWLEFARLSKPADPWAAALDAGVIPLQAVALATQLDALPGSVVAEGAGGIMVPLNEHEQIGDVAARAKLSAIVVVGLRLGCINHALLTLQRCDALALVVAGVVLVERWGATGEAYRADVRRALEPRARVLGLVAYDESEAASVAAAAALFKPLVKEER